MKKDKKKILYIVTKSNWGGHTRKPTVFRHATPLSVWHCLPPRGNKCFPDPLPRPAEPFASKKS